MSNDRASTRTDIENKWKAEIGKAFCQKEVELATKMRDISNHVVDFIVDCKELLESCNVQQSSQLPSYYQNASTSKAENQFPTQNPITSQSRNTGQTKRIDSSLTSNEIEIKLDSSLAHLKESFPFAKIIPGTNAQVNKDRLLIIFGKCWKTDFKLDVSRAVIDGNSNLACDNVCNLKIHPFKAVCLLPNPDWLTTQKAEWEAFKDFNRIILYLRSKLPGAVLMIGTYPIESGTLCDPLYFTFNLEILRLYNKPEANYRIFKTIDLLPDLYGTELHGEKRHYLSDNLTVPMMKELSDRLATFDANFDDDY